jgi:hypothetical protein
MTLAVIWAVVSHHGPPGVLETRIDHTRRLTDNKKQYEEKQNKRDQRFHIHLLKN